jgi:hypothetical protein
VPDITVLVPVILSCFYSKHNVVAECLDFVDVPPPPICDFSIQGLLHTKTVHHVDVKVRSFAKGVT